MGVDELPPVEMRFMTPRIVVDVLDAASGHMGISRARLVNRVLKEFAVREVHRMTVMQAVTQGNPALMELTWKDTET